MMSRRAACAIVRQKKTGRPVQFELTETTRQAVDDYLKTTGKGPGDYLFAGCRRYNLFGTHSLRRTKATLSYRRTGNLRAAQLLLGHTRIESTVRYLGIEVDDALAKAEQVDV